MSRRRRIPIAQDGVVFIIVAFALMLLTWALGWERPAAVCFLLLIFLIAFFRDPEREIRAQKGEVLSPADGRVLIVETVQDPPHLRGQWQKITVFMSMFNAHVNRVPISGTVKSIRYQPGRFLMGFSEKASAENEQNAVLLEGAPGEKVMMVQIAGLVARRIVCHLEKGQEVRVGERFGLIRFGSRADVYVPADADILVVKGDRVKAGLSVLARFGEASIGPAPSD